MGKERGALSVSSSFLHRGDDLKAKGCLPGNLGEVAVPRILRGDRQRPGAFGEGESGADDEARRGIV